MAVDKDISAVSIRKHTTILHPVSASSNDITYLVEIEAMQRQESKGVTCFAAYFHVVDSCSAADTSISMAQFCMYPGLLSESCVLIVSAENLVCFGAVLFLLVCTCARCMPQIEMHSTFCCKFKLFIIHGKGTYWINW